MDPDDHRHGTVNGYTNLDCGCESCRTANAVHMREQRKRREERGCPDDQHGTANGYGNWLCRCDKCTTAWAENMWVQRDRRRLKQTDVALGLCPSPIQRP